MDKETIITIGMDTCSGHTEDGFFFDDEDLVKCVKTCIANELFALVVEAHEFEHVSVRKIRKRANELAWPGVRIYVEGGCKS